jgi:hypothetical protein
MAGAGGGGAVTMGGAWRGWGTTMRRGAGAGASAFGGAAGALAGGAALAAGVGGAAG